MTNIDLTEFERELLERASIGGARFGVALDCLDEELLERSPGRKTIETSLRSLGERRLVRSVWSSGSLTLRPRDGIHPLSEVAQRQTVHREYEGDWWVLTDEGRRAIGLEPATATSRKRRAVLVLSEESASRLDELAQSAYVWAIRTPATEAAAARIWHEVRKTDRDACITLFDSAGDDGLLSLVAEIVLHHGEASSQAVSEIEVLGATANDRVRRELATAGFWQVSDTATGFVIFPTTGPEPELAEVRFIVLDHVIEDNYGLREIQGFASRDVLRHAITELASEGLIAIGRYGELDGRVAGRATPLDAESVLADEESWWPPEQRGYDDVIAIGITKSGIAEQSRLVSRRHSS
jgi:hypothetical protein